MGKSVAAGFVRLSERTALAGKMLDAAPLQTGIGDEVQVKRNLQCLSTSRNEIFLPGPVSASEKRADTAE